LNREELVVIQLQSAAAEIETDGKLMDARQLTMAILTNLSDPVESELASNTRFWTLLYIARIEFLIQKYARYYEGVDQTFKTQLNDKMRVLQYQLHEIGDDFAAWDVIQYRLLFLDLPQADRELCAFLSRSNQPYTMASAMLERSKIARTQKRFPEAQNLLQLAKDQFAADHLTLGSVEAELELINLWIEEQGGASTECLDALGRLANSFHEQQYLTGEREALSRLALLYREMQRYSDSSRISSQLQEICDLTGSKLEWYHHRFGQLVASSMAGDQVAATLEGFKALYEKVERMQVPSLASKCATQVSVDYMQQKDWDNSLLWGRKALCMAESNSDYSSASDAAKSVALCMRDRITHADIPSRENIKELIAFLSTWSESDGRNGIIVNQIDKYGLLSNAEILYARRFDDVDKFEASKRCLSWLRKAEQLLDFLPEEERITNMAEIKFKSYDAYYILDDYSTAMGYLELARLLFTQTGKNRQAKHMQNKLGQLKLLMVYKAELSGGMQAQDVQAALSESLENFQEVQQALLKSGFMLQLANCHLQQAWIWQAAYERGQPEALGYALEELSAADSIGNDIRADMTIQKDEEILAHKSALVSQSAGLYELGIKLSLESKDVGQAWQWAQQGKARAFLDLLSFEETAPLKVIGSVQESIEAQDLLRRESELLRTLQTTPLQRRFPIRREIAATRRQMSSVPQLYNLLLYRGSKTLTLDCLPEMFRPLSHVVCVDWALVGDAIWMFTVRPGEEPKAHLLAITMPEVSLWIQSNLKAEYMRQNRAYERLRDLDPLIAPLSDCTSANELLVFCPTSLLCAIPFHALEAGGQLLLERNPVVYSSSLSVLYHCMLRRSEKSCSLKNASIFGNPTGDRSAAEESSLRLAELLHVKPYVRSAATKSAFIAQAQDTTLFHYHGHAAFDAEDPLHSAFTLHQNESATSSENQLTARELLALRLSVSLFVMIACESAQQEIKAGGEPTGLLPMLLLAGVNAAIGTLWKCSDVAGKEFTEVFYREVLSGIERRSSDAILVDFAVALQKAALKLRERRPAPYFWAPFVLHGNWLHHFDSEKDDSIVADLESTAGQR
jgi:CHAT domain-containing protein